jgi:LEA14-like dessication related protein
MKTLFLLLAMVMIALGAGCTGDAIIQEPTAEVTAIAITGIGLQQLDLDVSVLVGNPNPVGGTIETIEFDIFFDENGRETFLGRGGGGPVSLPAGGETEVTLPVSVSTPGLVQAILAAARDGGVVLVVRGTGGISIAGIPFEVPFEAKQTITI